MWKGAVTNMGVALLKKWAAGGTMSITGAKGASGYVDEAQLASQADLTNVMQALSITGYSAQGSGIAYRVQVLAASAEYTLRQIGIYGKLDSGSETLIAIYQDAGGMTVPALSVAPDFVFEFTATVQMSNEGSLTVNVDTSALVGRSEMEAYVSAAIASLNFEEYDAHLAARNNPHGVTAEQAGAAKAQHYHGNLTPDGKISGGTASRVVVTKSDGNLGTADAAAVREMVGASPTGHTHEMSSVNGLTGALAGKADAGHSQAAGTITAGTLAGEVKANANAQKTLSRAQVRNISAGTEDLQAGISPLATGEVYLVYE